MKLVFVILLGIAAFFWLSMGPDEVDAAQRLADTVKDREIEARYEAVKAKLCDHHIRHCKE